MSMKYDTQLVNYSNYANGISWSDGSIKKTSLLEEMVKF